MKKKTKIISALVGAVVLISAGTGIALASNHQPQEDVMLREYTVTRGNITTSLSGGGVIEAEITDYSFSMDVVIGDVLVEVGQPVKKGDPLVNISQEAMQQKLDDLKVNLKKMELALEDAKNAVSLNKHNQKSAQDQSVRESEDSHVMKKTNLESTISNLEKDSVELQQQIDTISGQIAEIEQQPVPLSPELEEELQTLKQQRERLHTQRESVKNELDAANKSLSELDQSRQMELDRQRQKAKDDKKANSLTVEGLENAVIKAQIDVQSIQDQINKNEALLNAPVLKSDTDGVVLSINFIKNESVLAGQTVVSVGKAGQIYAKVLVSQDDISKVEEGQLVELDLTAYPDELLTGTVKQIYLTPAPGQSDVLYAVIVTLDQTDKELMSGMTLSANFITKQVVDVLKLSNKAIRMEEGRQMVTIQHDDGSLQDVEITTGFSDGKSSEITSGLKEGDIVVMEG